MSRKTFSDEVLSTIHQYEGNLTRPTRTIDMNTLPVRGTEYMPELFLLQIQALAKQRMEAIEGRPLPFLNMSLPLHIHWNDPLKDFGNPYQIYDKIILPDRPDTREMYQRTLSNPMASSNTKRFRDMLVHETVHAFQKTFLSNFVSIYEKQYPFLKWRRFKIKNELHNLPVTMQDRIVINPDAPDPFEATILGTDQRFYVNILTSNPGKKPTGLWISKDSRLPNDIWNIDQNNTGLYGLKHPHIDWKSTNHQHPHEWYAYATENLHPDV